MNQLRQSPFCADLRSKKYFFLQGPPMRAEDLLDASNDCWCARTTQRLGPDKDLVHPDDCVAGRPCFRSLYAVPDQVSAPAPTHAPERVES